MTSAPLWGSVSPIRGRGSYYRSDCRNQGEMKRSRRKRPWKPAGSCGPAYVFHSSPVPPAPIIAHHCALITHLYSHHPNLISAATSAPHSQVLHCAASLYSLTLSLFTAKSPPFTVEPAPDWVTVLALPDLPAAFDKG